MMMQAAAQERVFCHENRQGNLRVLMERSSIRDLRSLIMLKHKADWIPARLGRMQTVHHICGCENASANQGSLSGSTSCQNTK